MALLHLTPLRVRSIVLQLLSLCISLSVTDSSFAADPVWHCSRSVPVEAPVSLSSMSFDLSESTTIEVAPMDLFQVYSGGTVLMGSKPLSACFIDRSKLTEKAMSEIDVDTASLNALSKPEAIVQARIHSVRNEEEMKSCVAKFHPAVGYLSQVTETDLIGPCF